MTPQEAKDELNYILQQQSEEFDPEIHHEDADNVLCELLSYLGYDDIVNLYQQIDKWYA